MTRAADPRLKLNFLAAQVRAVLEDTARRFAALTDAAALPLLRGHLVGCLRAVDNYIAAHEKANPPTLTKGESGGGG
jgi:hypothetical protein